jgi:hypothetical protein
MDVVTEKLAQLRAHLNEYPALRQAEVSVASDLTIFRARGSLTPFRDITHRNLQVSPRNS